MLQNSGEGTATAENISKVSAQILRIEKCANDTEIITYVIHCRDLSTNSLFQYQCKDSDLTDTSFVSLAWESANISFINSVFSSEDISLFIHHPQTVIVLEPDFLIDASAIADCFLDRTSNENLYFLQRCLPSPSSASMIFGILVNQLLDAYLEQDDPDFQTVYKNTLIANIFTALFIGKEELNKLRKQVIIEHMPVIHQVTELWKNKQISLEPTFISVDYGLQGRLDVLLEVRSANFEVRSEECKVRSSKFEVRIEDVGVCGSKPDMQSEAISIVAPPAPLIKGGNQQDIIELKSSKARDTAVWTNHRMQVVCYHLLLRSVYGNKRQGKNYILYSRAPKNPLREVPTLDTWEKQVISVRNAIISKIHSIAFEKGSLLGFNIENFGEFQIFKKEDILEFQKLVQGLSSVEHSYIERFVQFLFRELWQTKVGYTTKHRINYGFNGLWKLTRSAKKEDFSIMDNLSFQSTDGNKITFHMPAEREISNFRVGDIVILYPDNDDVNCLLKDQLRKGFIVELTNHELILQMKNNSLLQSVLSRHPLWMIEHDFMESGSVNMIRGMFNFMRGDRRKRELILGIAEPKSDHFSHETDETERIIQKGLAAKDYFLLQGPPGTGKTSRILMNLVVRILANTDEQIMILAFTNRAVDEICERLLQNDVEFLRLGNGTNTQNRYLSHMIQDMTFLEIEELLDSSRVFVSTVSSFLGQFQELLRVKHFDTLFVDEASQLLEPHLAGILIHIHRFILIGDQNQLPAVITQHENDLISDDAELASLGFNSLHQSLFERLYRRCVEQHWDHAYDMLTSHYRMHADIQNLVNHFYQDRLRTNSLRQTTAWPQITNTKERIAEILASSRVLFFAVTSNQDFKRSTGEARLVALLLQTIRKQYQRSFDSEKVGVITTWRAQINEIAAHLKDEELIHNVTVDTVERFQGSERDIIIFSTALSDPGQLQMIQSLSPDLTVDRKLNVAISRAREQFILIGDPSVLNQSEYYRRILAIIKTMNGYYNENLECIVD